MSFVPNFVPESANMTLDNRTQEDEKGLYTAKAVLQAANHNPRVGGSSPSSGTAQCLFPCDFEYQGGAGTAIILP